VALAPDGAADRCEVASSRPHAPRLRARRGGISRRPADSEATSHPRWPCAVTADCEEGNCARWPADPGGLDGGRSGPRPAEDREAPSDVEREPVQICLGGRARAVVPVAPRTFSARCRSARLTTAEPEAPPGNRCRSPRTMRDRPGGQTR
jgi:hypothetical protein